MCQYRESRHIREDCCKKITHNCGKILKISCLFVLLENLIKLTKVSLNQLSMKRATPSGAPVDVWPRTPKITRNSSASID